MDGPEWGFHADANLNARSEGFPPSSFCRVGGMSMSSCPNLNGRFPRSTFSCGFNFERKGYEAVGGKYEDALIIHRLTLRSHQSKLPSSIMINDPIIAGIIVIVTCSAAPKSNHILDEMIILGDVGNIYPQIKSYCAECQASLNTNDGSPFRPFLCD